MTLAEKLLPQNVEAEACVLGSILIDPDCFADVRAILRPVDFFRPAHRTVYEAIETLWRTQQPADLITLCDELQRAGSLEDIGGASFIGSLANQVPTSANVEQYAAIVARTALARRVIHAAGQIAGVAYHEPDADVIASQASSILTEALSRRVGADSVTLLDAAQAFIDEHAAVIQDGGAPSGVRYGLDGLDKVLLGIKPGELVYLCGRPGAGKSALAAHIALKAAEACADADEGRGAGTVEYLTFEMRSAQVVGRLVARQASINTHALRANFIQRDGTVDELAWSAACDAAVALQVRVGERLRFTTRRQRLADIRLLLERAVAQRDCRFAVVDYLGLIAPEDDRDARQAEYQRITNLSRDLKQLAMTLDIPILCLVQMSRASEHRSDPRPVTSDLRDSGGLEQDGDMVIGLVRMASYLPRLAQAHERFGQFAEAHLLKTRDGSQSGLVVPLRFEAPFTRFSDWPREWPYGDYLRLMPSDDGQTQAGMSGDGESEWGQ
jgi:replicative DNA helicase